MIGLTGGAAVTAGNLINEATASLLVKPLTGVITGTSGADGTIIGFVTLAAAGTTTGTSGLTGTLANATTIGSLPVTLTVKPALGITLTVVPAVAATVEVHDQLEAQAVVLAPLTMTLPLESMAHTLTRRAALTPQAVRKPAITLTLTRRARLAITLTVAA